MAADSASNPFASDESQKQEHVGYIVREPDGRYSAIPIPTVPVTNNCLSTWPAPGPGDLLPGEVLVALFHTHPYAVDQTIHCSDGRVGGAAPGGSLDYDWPNMRTLYAKSTWPADWKHVPWYIIDTYNVYKMDPDLGPGPDETPVAQWRKKTSSDPVCAWQ